ncbi:hypothetical protein F4861DRAFT_541593 [Xylaria intraflava]|nr:hypothetical protein F4861DRAFT_541593 [Xylaria intraflava]
MDNLLLLVVSVEPANANTGNVDSISHWPNNNCRGGAAELVDGGGGRQERGGEEQGGLEPGGRRRKKTENGRPGDLETGKTGDWRLVTGENGETGETDGLSRLES